MTVDDIWERARVGDELPPLQFEITRTTLALDIIGTHDTYPIHHDHEFAHAVGVRDIFLNTQWYQGAIGRFATNWAGPGSYLRKLAITLRAPSCPGDVLIIRGTITAKREMGTQQLVDMTVTIDGKEPDSVIAKTTVQVL